MQDKFYNKTGFTLIELMVVIAIIGILSTILYASFDVAKSQSRDKVRMASLKELQLAIELYKAQNGVFPPQGCGTPGSIWAGPGPQPASGATCDNYISGLAPDFLPALPRDPSQEMVNGKGFIYMTNAGGSAYKIMVHRSVESLQITSFDDKFARCPVVNGGSCPTIGSIADIYSVYSTGAESW